MRCISEARAQRETNRNDERHLAAAERNLKVEAQSERDRGRRKGRWINDAKRTISEENQSG